jgi:MFS transporter, FSR family, fosmidomycin resistance protein
MKLPLVALNLFAYGLTHALVDASCIMLLLSGIDVKGDILLYILSYNLLAFGLQVPFGWLNDRIQQPVKSAIFGCVLLSVSMTLFNHPIIAIILAGIGNASFHIGGGALSLKTGKAALPGLFVAPGSIGLLIGGIVSTTFGFHPEIIASLLLFMGLTLFFLKSPVFIYENRKVNESNYLAITILLLLTTICFRSAVGLSLNYPWKSNMTLLICLTAAIALGKGLGGLLADYFGWIKIAVGGLTISTLLLFFGPKIAVAGIAGLFFFNLTMPVCLVAISNLLPGKPGFSFGLTAFAMVVGALPTFFKTKTVISASPVILILVILSTITLFSGLKLYIQEQTKLKL